MRSWLDLETRFRALATPLKWARLECTWGAVPERWRLTGSRNYRHRVETLCGIGGQLLDKSINSDSELGIVLFAGADPKIWWYRLLRNTCDEVRSELAGWRVHEAEKSHDLIFFATINHLAEVCANKCRELEVLYPLEEKRKWQLLLSDDDHRKETVVGTLLVIGTAITAVARSFFR